MANFRAQVIFGVSFGDPFPTLGVMDFQIILVLDVPGSVEHPRHLEVFANFARTFIWRMFSNCKLFSDTPCIVQLVKLMLS